MASLLTLRPAPPPLPSWLADAVPHAFEEAGKVQFKAMPGIQWIADRASPNGRGFYRGSREAIELVAATLESAGVCKVRAELGGPAPDIFRDQPPGFGADDKRLRAYQADGVAWLRWMLAHTGGALLADEMGLGKTPQAIVALCSDSAATLIVCPAVVEPHWNDEIYKWARINEGSSCSKLWRVLSYDKFRIAAAKGALPDPGGYTRVVFDEIHYLSNPKSKRSKAAHEWLAAQPIRPLMIGLSGTPMSTSPKDLWHPLELLWPGRFGSWWQFAKRYCDGHFEDIVNASGARVTDQSGEPLKPAWVAEGISRAEELRSRLVHCMLRRTKSQVGAELPPRTRTILEVALPTAARRDLRAATAALDFGAARSAVGSLLAHAESYKIDAAEALARDVISVGSRPLLLTTRKESAWELGNRLACPFVTGDDPALERRAKIADAHCAAATLYSVETGINLTGFDVIIFVGLDWVPARILQGEARIHRIGADKPVTIYFLIARGTVDEVIRERVIERLENFAAVTGAKGDELGLVGDLAPESEEDLIAAIVAAVKGK